MQQSRPDPDFPWAENHTFEALVSNNNSLNLDEIEERLSFRHEAKYIGLSYVNPIGSHATIKFDSLVNDIDVNLKIKIFDQQGKLLSEKYSHFINGILEINVEEFNSGFLIFLFTLKNAQYAIPVIKQ
jgi:hypothetical protein